MNNFFLHTKLLKHGKMNVTLIEKLGVYGPCPVIEGSKVFFHYQKSLNKAEKAEIAMKWTVCDYDIY